MCEICEKVKTQVEERGYSTGYIPVPVWNGKEWIPVSYVYPVTDKVMCWPEGLDTTTLPRPLYQLGDMVTFNWGKSAVYEGHIQRIKLHGGSYLSFEGPALRVCEERYNKRENMTYTIYANGHGRWVREDKIIEKVGVHHHPIV